MNVNSINNNCRNSLHPRNQEIFTLIAEISTQNQQEPSIRDLPSIAHEREELVTHIE